MAAGIMQTDQKQVKLISPITDPQLFWLPILFFDFFYKSHKIQPRLVENSAAIGVEQPRLVKPPKIIDKNVVIRPLDYLSIENSATYSSFSHEYVIQPRHMVHSAATRTRWILALDPIDLQSLRCPEVCDLSDGKGFQTKTVSETWSWS